MVSFIVYDLIFLVLFSIVAIIMFHKTRSSWKRHGWIFLYHSKFGIKFIDWTAKKFGWFLRPMQYVVILSGYTLMAFIVWLMGFSVWRYLTSPIPEAIQKVPPIAPLIPYFPKLFGLEAFFPPLFFTYFLIALAIVAVSHEFAHGIYARLYNIKVKTTGLAFFGPFFGAFVEPDEKVMYAAPKKQQLVILAAGTFANVVMTVLFLLLLWAYFTASFTPAGVNFNAYPQSVITIGSISDIGGLPLKSFDELHPNIKEGLNQITVEEQTYLVPGETLKRAIDAQAEQIVVFDDAPAVRAELRSPILEIDGEVITSPEMLRNKLENYDAGDTVGIITLEDGERKNQIIELDGKDGKAYLGIGFVDGRRGFVGMIFGLIQEIRNPLIYYEPAWDGDFVQFIYDLLWWIVVINILVALFNMLPVSILDGGRFFMLTVLGITRSEKIAKKSFSYATWLIVILLGLMMVRWVFVFLR